MNAFNCLLSKGCIYNEDFDPERRPICFEEDGLFETMCLAGLLCWLLLSEFLRLLLKQYYTHITVGLVGLVVVDGL